MVDGGVCVGTVAWRAAALEHLDDDHATAAARTRVRERLGSIGAVRIPGPRLCRRQAGQEARAGDVVGARAGGEQAVVTDAVEALRQDMDQEATDELGG